MFFDCSSVFDKKKRPHVILLHKRSRLSLYQEHSTEAQRIEQLTKTQDSSIEHLQKEHSAHHECLTFVINQLKSIGAVIHTADELKNILQYQVAPAIVTVGGDGTVLEASHLAYQGPIFGINSNPQQSVGALCIARQQNFSSLFNAFLKGLLKVQALNKIGITLNNQPQKFHALNEILVAHANTAASSRYALHLDGLTERQLSSGVWISTAAGSTGAMNSAGGMYCPLDDQRLQYAVREPCFFWGQKPTLIRGLFTEKNHLELISHMPQGRIFFDGPYKWIDFLIGDRLAVFNARPSLLVVNEDLELRRAHLAQLRESSFVGDTI